MELAGNEKRIQALFRELKFADGSIAPEFTRMWNRAQATAAASSSVFKLSFTLAISLAVVALCSLGLWSRNWERIQTSIPDVVSVLEEPGLTPILPSDATGSTQLIAEFRPRPKANRSVRKLRARRRPDINVVDAVLPEAVAISSWQSPTAMFLQSPADQMLTSLPQLDLAVKNLKIFLPDTLQ